MGEIDVVTAVVVRGKSLWRWASLRVGPRGGWRATVRWAARLPDDGPTAGQATASGRMLLWHSQRWTAIRDGGAPC